jgi:uncharacterized protein (TIGR03790 family)
MPRTALRLTAAALALLAAPAAARALGPADVYLIVNKNVPASRAVAEYYCSRRGVPKDHILAFDLPAGDNVSRASYEADLAKPLRALLAGKRDKVKVLLTTYGVPLRVGPDAPSPAEKRELDKLKPRLAELYKKRDRLDARRKKIEAKGRPNPREGDEWDVVRKERAALDGKEIRPLEVRCAWLGHKEAAAALDSELALLWQPPSELRRWQSNPLYFRAAGAPRKGAPPVVMTCRLDGPGAAVVKGLVDKALAAEKRGLAGRVYLDARGMKYDPKADPAGLGYEAYDESLREAARLLKAGGLAVTLDDKVEQFPPGSCPDCALYCGWYSHAKYIDSCTFVPGAVGYHMASSEAVSLHDRKATYWCKCMLEKGITATLGPVAEPYTLGFPKPAEFLGSLATGEYTLVESYWRSLRFGSWMMVLVGDPLYNPFAKRPRVRGAAVEPSPAGAR